MRTVISEKFRTERIDIALQVRGVNYNRKEEIGLIQTKKRFGTGTWIVIGFEIQIHSYKHIASFVGAWIAIAMTNISYACFWLFLCRGVNWNSYIHLKNVVALPRNMMFAFGRSLCGSVNCNIYNIMSYFDGERHSLCRSVNWNWKVKLLMEGRTLGMRAWIVINLHQFVLKVKALFYRSVNWNNKINKYARQTSAASSTEREL